MINQMKLSRGHFKKMINEKKLQKEFLEKGLIVKPVLAKKSLMWIKKKYIKIINQELKRMNKKVPKNFDIFNSVHKLIKSEEINDFRLKTFGEINKLKDFRKHYYEIAKPYLKILVGDELVMQKKVNLSIQCPKDKSSLLPIHADTWDGDSPFEIVVWLPLVDCFKTKSMFMLPGNQNKIFNRIYKKNKNDKFDIFKTLKNKLKWIDIKFGEVLIFNLCIPHGNIINNEKETRWSMNCRFKNLFSPYADKKLGEFFSPIELKPITKIGLNYKFPDEE